MERVTDFYSLISELGAIGELLFTSDQVNDIGLFLVSIFSCEGIPGPCHAVRGDSVSFEAALLAPSVVSSSTQISTSLTRKSKWYELGQVNLNHN